MGQNFCFFWRTTMGTPDIASFSDSPRNPAKEPLKLDIKLKGRKFELLYDAAATGNRKTVAYLINNACNPNVKVPEREEQTPLHGAVIGDQYSTVKLLMQKRAMPDVEDAHHHTPLFYAANASIEVGKLLLEKGAEITCGPELVMEGLKRSNIKYVDELIKRRVEVNEECLLLALEQGKWKSASKIKRRMKNFYEQKPKILNTLVDKGKIKGVKWILDKGADPNQSYEGVKPLHLAAEKGFSKIADFLIQGDADVNGLIYKDKRPHRTPLEIAAENGKTKLVKVLLNYRAEIDLCTTEASTPLYLATEKGHFKTSQLLIARGADINYSKKTGATLLHKLTTSSKSHFKAADFLKQQGASEFIPSPRRKGKERAKSVDLSGNHSRSNIIHTFSALE